MKNCSNAVPSFVASHIFILRNMSYPIYRWMVMVQEVHRDSVKLIENEIEEEPRRPNRKVFQKDLECVNINLTTLKKELNGQSKDLNLLKEKISKIGAERRQLYVLKSTIKCELDELNTKLKTLKNAQLELEKECNWRSLEKVEEYLKNNSERYQKCNLSRREEQLIVDEMNLLKRNKTKLLRLADNQKEQEQIEKDISICKERRNNIYNATNDHKKQLRLAKNSEMDFQKKLQDIKRDLHKCYSQRSDLITEYTTDRTVYSKWAQKNRKKAITNTSSYPATFPIHHVRNSFCFDDEELEPFFEQKRDCLRLIHYLERLETQLSKTEVNVKQSVDSDSDSADDYPASFSSLTISAPVVKPSSSKASKKHAKTKKTNESQPISHDVEIYNLFGTVGVDVPKVYSEVPAVLEETRTKLAFFEQQTNEIDWHEELNGLGDVMTVSRTCSEFTNDSYLDSASECASVQSFRRTGSGLESPMSTSNGDAFLSN